MTLPKWVFCFTLERVMTEKKSFSYTKSELSASRKDALGKVIEFLSVDDVENQFAGRDNSYYSRDKFVIVWKANKSGFACEERLDLCDSSYAIFSGMKCCHVSVGLFHEKMIKGFETIEHGLIEIGLLLSPKEEKHRFFDKYAKPYNQKVLSRRNLVQTTNWRSEHEAPPQDNRSRGE